MTSLASMVLRAIWAGRLSDPVVIAIPGHPALVL